MPIRVIRGPKTSDLELTAPPPAAIPMSLRKSLLLGASLAVTTLALAADLNLPPIAEGPYKPDHYRY